MKKIITLCMVSLLAVALVFTVGAAQLGEGWSAVMEMDADLYGKSEGAVIVNDDGSISLEVPAGNWWPQAGVVFDTPLDIDGLEVVASFTGHTNPSPNGFGAIILSKYKPTDFGLLLIRAYAPMWSKNLSEGLFISVFGTDEGNICMDGAMETPFENKGEDTIVKTIPLDKDVKFSFAVKDDGSIDISVDGEVIVTVEAEAAAGMMTDGQAYLTFAATGFGDSGSKGSHTIKSINGKAANTFPDGGEYVPSENESKPDASEPDTSSSEPADVSSEPTSSVNSSSSSSQKGGCGNKAD